MNLNSSQEYQFRKGPGIIRGIVRIQYCLLQNPSSSIPSTSIPDNLFTYVRRDWGRGVVFLGTLMLVPVRFVEFRWRHILDCTWCASKLLNAYWIFLKKANKYKLLNFYSFLGLFPINCVLQCIQRIMWCDIWFAWWFSYCTV